MADWVGQTGEAESETAGPSAAARLSEALAAKGRSVPIGWTPRRPAAKRREELREAGAAMMASDGIFDVAITAISQKAGFSPAAYHYWYDTRADLTFDIAYTHLDTVMEKVGRADEAFEQAEPAERLTMLALAFLEAIRAGENAHRVTIATLHATARDKKGQDTLRYWSRLLATQVLLVIVAAVPELDQRPDLLMPLTMSFLAMAGWSVLWFRDDGRMAREAYARLMAEMVLRGARAALDRWPGGAGASACEESSLAQALERVLALESKDWPGRAGKPARIPGTAVPAADPVVPRRTSGEAEVLAALRARLDRAFAERLEHAVLFGSRARGEVKLDADYDVAVFLQVTRNIAGDRETLTTIAAEMLRETGAMLHLRRFPPGDYQRPHGPVLIAVCREGVAI